MKTRGSMQSLATPHRLAQAVFAVLATAAVALAPQHASAGAFISVNIAPPLLPVYAQPEIPGPGYLWTPGFWSYDPDGGYYWVPGTWVMAPYSGALWTPGYWGYGEHVYVFHPGYWGAHVGYYGGINYGYGYSGVGYYGGYWRHDGFYYNTAFNHWSGGGGFHLNVYNRPYEHLSVSHFSFNGPGGELHRPSSIELVAEHDRHTPAIALQVQHEDAARHDQTLRASVNHGVPVVAATAKAGDFTHATAATAAGDKAVAAAVPHAATDEKAAAGKASTAAATGEHHSSHHTSTTHASSGSSTHETRASTGHAESHHHASEHATAAGAPHSPAAMSPAHGGEAPHASTHAPAHSESHGAPHEAKAPHEEKHSSGGGKPKDHDHHG